ncbi:MAG: NAD(P)H-dependent glycerol-3-phosphate dehydrogenase [Acidiferrobacter sp.]
MLSDIDTPKVSQHYNFDCATVLGAGAWGTALSAVLQRSGYKVTLWAREPNLAHLIETENCNPRYLPDIRLPEGIHAVSDLAEAVTGADWIMMAVPTSALREVARRAAQYTGGKVPLLLACKGFEQGTGALMTEVIEGACNTPLAGVLASPSFAAEVARGEAAALTLAMADLADEKGAPLADEFARVMVERLACVGIQLDITCDATGAQVCGALKNVIAIACGLAEGYGLGENARASVVTRGLHDMRKLIVALGGRVETLFSNCGIGDVFLSASSGRSRNYRFGFELGCGRWPERRELVEGATCAEATYLLEQDLDLVLGILPPLRALLRREITAGAALDRMLIGPAPETHSRRIGHPVHRTDDTPLRIPHQHTLKAFPRIRP